jgi:nicotinate-nucleotide adenylyltransferase
MRIGVYGGSFDPPHLGHRQAAQSFIASGFIDKLLIIPAFEAPVKRKHIASFEQRLAMCALNFRGISDHILISDLESKLPTPNFTMQTLEHLSKSQPENQFLLCVGADCVAHLAKWHRGEELLRAFRVLAVDRPGFIRYEPPSSNVTWIPHHEVDAASRFVREGAKKKDHEVLKNVHPDVRSYIEEQKLYC